MIVGFTGTRRGMSRDQQLRVFSLLQHFGPKETRHGDCQGADEQFHEMCYTIGIPIHVHPPKDETYRAYCSTGIITPYPPQDFYVRDRHIVQGSTLLIGTPLNDRSRGGTWYTMNYARKYGKKVYKVLRDGSVRLLIGKEEFPWGEELDLG